MPCVNSTSMLLCVCVYMYNVDNHDIITVRAYDVDVETKDDDAANEVCVCVHVLEQCLQLFSVQHVNFYKESP